jgi:NADPH:quinone reductase-like Zn-dependent oxidoreductase
MFQRAIVRSFGSPSRVVELEAYLPGELARGQVRIIMKTTTINPSDLITISGAYRSRTPLPFMPGFEGVGVITEIGPGCSRLVPGQRVIPIGTPGSWQNMKDNAEEWCLVVPDGLDDQQAATSYINPLTAWAMLHEEYRIRPGMTVAVSAAGSAIGRMIIRLANDMGITPVAFYRSEQAGINLFGLSAKKFRYGNSSSLAEICSHWAGPKIDAFFDCVGGGDAVAFSRLIKPGGLFVHYGLLSGQPITSSSWIREDVNIRLFHLRNWIRTVPREQVHQAYHRVTALISAGEISTDVRARYPLHQITAALIEAETASPHGKVLLDH